MNSAARIALRLKGRLLGKLHLGQLRPGDRLPSTRTLADQFGEDHRAVADAYRILERDGLVEVRPRSGVFVAHHEELGDDGPILADTGHWLREVAVGAWLRHIRLPELAGLIDRYASSGSLTCLYVESVTDPLVAIGTELERDFGLAVELLRVPAPERAQGTGPTCFPPQMAERVRAADFVVTTAFHAGPLWALLHGQSIDRPVITLSINPNWRGILVEAMEDQGLTVVHADPVAPERFRLVIQAHDHDRLRFVPVEDSEVWRNAASEGPVYLTLAARNAADTEGVTLLRPGAPVLSVETAREVVDTMIRLNLRGSVR